jgi:hypothetical protein
MNTIIRARFYNFCGWTIDFLSRGSPKSATIDASKAKELKEKIDEIGKKITEIHNKMWNDITPLINEQKETYKKYVGDEPPL